MCVVMVVQTVSMTASQWKKETGWHELGG